MSRNRRVQVEFTLPQLHMINAGLALLEADPDQGADETYRDDVMKRTRYKVWAALTVADPDRSA